jgi:2-keto-4-pentenoate hydratase
MNTINELARHIVLADINGEHVPFPTSALSLSDAYELQRACVQFGQTDAAIPKHLKTHYETIGYKIGATSEETQQFLGLNEPFHGPLFRGKSARLVDASSMLAFTAHMQHLPRVEAEFVVCLKNDLRWQQNDFTIADIEEHIDWIAPGLEFVGSRFEGAAGSPGTSVIGDLGANLFMLLGKPYTHWQELDLTQLPVSLGFASNLSNPNDWPEPAVQGHSGMSVFGNPLGAVCWLLNHETMRDTGIKAGEWISCGTCTGALPVEPNLPVTAADFGVLGKLSGKTDPAQHG